MNRVDIYTKSYCPYCMRAKALLDSEGVSYHEHEVSTNQALQQEMRDRSGRRTVPQIFINGHHLGGNDDLVAANNNGLLDELLGSQPATTA